MFSTLSPKLTSALALLVMLGAPQTAGAKDKTALPTSDLTGTVNAGAGGLAKGATALVGSRAREAMERFEGARAAMEHALLLREDAPKGDIAAIETNMKGLIGSLAAIEQMDHSRLSESAKEARRLASDWYEAGMQILMPPAAGLTELPMPVGIASKADATDTAIERLVAATAARPAPSVAVATASAANVAVPPQLTMSPAATTRAAHAKRGALASQPAKPMSQNEASLRLLHDGLPLFLPPAALFMLKDEAAKR